MWTAENRARYDRSKLRYPSDLTDAEWELARREIPRAKRGGNKRTVDEREVLNGLMYVLGTGCQWRAIPKDLPPRSTVNFYFCRWQHDGTLDRLHHALYVRCREQAGREASPTAAIIDSQGVKSAEKGGRRSIGQASMAARRSKARSGTSMARLFGMYPFLLKLYADAGYQGPKFQAGMARVCRAVNVEIVRRCDSGRFVVLPKRWIVERTIAWLNRCRRLSKDWECLNRNALAFLRWASVRLMLRRLCQN
jgi:transposase